MMWFAVALVVLFVVVALAWSREAQQAKCELCGTRRADVVRRRSIPSGPGRGIVRDSCQPCADALDWKKAVGLAQPSAGATFVRFVGEVTVTGMYDGCANAYGSVRAKYSDGTEGPVICLHGGSAWLCVPCAADALAGRHYGAPRE